MDICQYSPKFKDQLREPLEKIAVTAYHSSINKVGCPYPYESIEAGLFTVFLACSWNYSIETAIDIYSVIH